MRFYEVIEKITQLDTHTEKNRFLRGANAPSIYLALVLFIFSILGLRDVVITAVIGKIIKNDVILSLMDGLYWISLILALLLGAVYLYLNRALFYEAIAARLGYAGYILTSFLLVTPFIYLTISKRFLLDYWLDEVMSIYRHIVPSISSALFWYPAPNNHIFSNALTGIYLQVIGHPSLLEIVQNPQLLRVFYLGFGLGAIMLFSITGYRFLGKWVGWMAVGLLCTTIPFLNFIVQVRGYSPSIFFVVALMFFTLRYRESYSQRDALFIAAFSSLLFYTIPSNIYFLLGQILFFAVLGGIPFLRKPEKIFRIKKQDFVFLNWEITVGVMIVLGIVISSLFYLPVLPQVIGNRYVETTGGLLRGTAIPDSLIYVLQLFVSNRIAVFIVAVIGLILSWVAAYRKKDERLLFMIQLSAAGFLLPFIISFIRGDRPYERIFLVTLPSFIFLAAIGIHHLLSLFSSSPTSKFLPGILLASVWVYSNVVFLDTYREIEQRIYTNLVEEKAIQVEVYDDTLWASHHLDHYYLNAVIAPLLEQYDGKTPILIDHDNTRFPWVIVVFLEAYDIPVTDVEDIQDIDVPEAFVFLSFPERSLAEFQSYFPATACSQISEEVSVYRVMRCRFTAFPVPLSTSANRAGAYPSTPLRYKRDILLSCLLHPRNSILAGYPGEQARSNTVLRC